MMFWPFNFGRIRKILERDPCSACFLGDHKHCMRSLDIPCGCKVSHD